MTELDALRNEILSIDEDILRLVQRRVAAAARIGELKERDGLPLENFAVEKNVLDHALAAGRALGLDAGIVQRLVRALIEASLGVQERARRVRRRAPAGHRALVVGGAGLMGGWFARFLSEQGYAVEVLDPRPSPWPKGDPRTGRFELVVVATPPSVLPGVLDGLLEALPPETVVLDIASVKGPAAGPLTRAARGGRHVASLHPMFGPQTELLMGQNVLHLDCGDARAVDASRALFADTTARSHTLPLADHDGLMAEVLGLAHAVSIVFSHTLAEGPRPYAGLAPYASTTFRKQVDVSREVAKENPRLYFEIQTLNDANGAVLQRLERSLDAFRGAVDGRDLAAFESMMTTARAWYEAGG